MDQQRPTTTARAAFDPSTIERPDERLRTYYAIVSASALVLWPIVFLPLLCRYLTLRYRFEADGLTMRWGLLFRREVTLSHRRIQDIHVTRGLLQRWMGLATVEVQTASGSAAPEVKIEGILQADELRDYLYAKMRGARGQGDAEAQPDDDEALVLLREIRDSVRALARGSGGANA